MKKKSKPTELAEHEVHPSFPLMCIGAGELFKEKDAEYGSAWKKFGLLGVIFELLGVLSRLPTMTIWKSPNEPLNKEKLRDLLLDLHNFSNMALILLAENNWDGKKGIE